MLETRHLGVAYGRHLAVEDVSVEVGAGEIVVMLGANGAGKSTLLRAIAGLTRATAGSVLVDGVETTRWPPNTIVEAGIALVPEDRGLFPDLSVIENLRLGAYPRRARGGMAETLAEVLALFPRLDERRRQVVRTMSGGEQQMVAIGRALMSAPEILLLDEPSLGLSPALTTELFRSLSRIRARGTGIFLVEQNARQSLAIGDRGYLLENGRVVGSGPTADLAADAAVQKAYLGAG